MPADCTIHYVSPDRGIDSLIPHLTSDLVADPFHTYLVVPKKQLARSIQKRLDLDEIPYIPEQISTIGEFCHNLTYHDMTGSNVLDSAEAMGILSMLFDQHKASFPLLRAYHRSTHIRELFRFFGEITKHSIPFPECLLDYNSEKIKELGELYELYQEHLRTHHYLDEYTIIEHTRRMIVEQHKEIGTIFCFGFFDLSPLEQDLMLALLDHAKKVDYTIPYGFDTAVFNTQPFFSCSANHTSLISEPETGKNSGFTHLFSHPDAKKQIHHLIQTPIYSTICVKEDDKNDRKNREKEYITGCATKTEEIVLIAKEITRLYALGETYEDITIAFPDPREILPFLEMVFAEYQIPFHTSQPLPFSSHPFSQFSINVLSLIEQGSSYQTLFPVVMRPYFKSQKLSGKEFDILMRWSHLDKITEDAIEDLVQRVEDSEHFDGKKQLPLPKTILLNTLNACMHLERELKALKGVKTPQEHAECIITFFHSIINTYHLHDEKSHIKNLYALFCTHLHKNTRFTSAYEKKITLEQYCSYTRHYIDQTTLPATSQGGVSVLGFRELAYQTCPYLFLAGLNEGVVPRLINRHPFTTKEETKRIGILKQEDIVRREQYLFIAALCAGKKALYLSAQNNESKNQIESSFFDQVVFNCHPNRWPVIDELDPEDDRGEVESNSDLALRVDIEQFYRKGTSRSIYDGIIASSPQITQLSCIEPYLTDTFGSDACWSVSKLENYAHCPFRFWIERILHIKPLEEIRQETASTEHGILVHQVLRELYETLQERKQLRLTNERAEESLSVLDEIINKHLLEQEWSPEPKAQIRALTGTRHTGTGSLKRFLLSDINHQDRSIHHMPSFFEFEFGKITPERAEITENTESNTPTVDLSDDEQDQMLFRGIIDRIDHIGEDYFGIIDYKTGVIPTMNEITNGLSLQLPLYMYAYQMLSGRTGIYGSHVQFKRRDVRGVSPLYNLEAVSYIPYLSSHPKKIQCDEIMYNAVIQVRNHIRDIRKGYFPITARSACPDTWCPYHMICRYDRERGSESGGYALYGEADGSLEMSGDGGEHGKE